MHNPCLSGGTLEIFLEPVVPAPLVVVHGTAPIARAVAGLAERLGYAVYAAVLEDGVDADADAVVVASHGHDEGPVLRAALDAGVPYIGLVASRRRGAGVLDALDLTPEERARIRTPAGLDIGARTPEEVALSILAEIVSIRPRGAPSGDATPRAATTPHRRRPGVRHDRRRDRVDPPPRPRRRHLLLLRPRLRGRVRRRPGAFLARQ